MADQGAAAPAGPSCVVILARIRVVRLVVDVNAVVVLKLAIVARILLPGVVGGCSP